MLNRNMKYEQNHRRFNGIQCVVQCENGSSKTENEFFRFIVRFGLIFQFRMYDFLKAIIIYLFICVRFFFLFSFLSISFTLYLFLYFNIKPTRVCFAHLLGLVRSHSNRIYHLECLHIVYILFDSVVFPFQISSSFYFSFLSSSSSSSSVEIDFLIFIHLIISNENLSSSSCYALNEIHLCSTKIKTNQQENN